MSTGIRDPGELFSNHRLNKAADDLASACSDMETGRFGDAVRSLYFACFHALGALLWKEGVWNSSMRRPRSVHKSLRSILHRDIIRTAVAGNSRLPLGAMADGAAENPNGEPVPERMAFRS